MNLMSEHIFFRIQGFLGQHPLLDTFLVIISDPWGIILCSGLVVYLVRHYGKKGLYDALAVVVGVLLAYTIAKLLKIGIESPRPFEFYQNLQTLYTWGGGDSWPSGHATLYFAFVGALWAEYRAFALAYLVGGLVVGSARIMLGLHWPIDILSGFLLGGCIGWATYALYRRYVKNQETHS